ncbi:MAG: thiamine phosphate synthase [Alphaproteobacteria bacterium]|nr:thiamine phosphate synthase [Alphaproteobacteria bacterium]
MSDSGERHALARAAARMNVKGVARGHLPPLIFIADDNRRADLDQIARALPKGSILVARARDDRARSALGAEMKSVAQSRQLLMLVASDPDLAVRLGADGIHLPETRRGEALTWRARRPGWMITIAAHSLAALRWLPADAAILAPVFPTASHPGGRYLSAIRTNAIARISPLPVYAMGGLNSENARRLSEKAFAGIAANSALQSARGTSGVEIDVKKIGIAVEPRA